MKISELILMKRTLLFTICILLFTVSTGFSAETTFFGYIDSRFNASDNLEDGQDNVDDQKDYMDSKLVLGVKSTFSEYLHGIAAFEAGSIIWGIDGENYPTGRNTGGGPSGDGVNVETKNIYLDASVPGMPVNLRCGLMPFDIADSMLAGDDAFGFTLSIGEDFNATLNVIRIYQESIGTRYAQNEDDPDRKEFFADLELTNKFNENVSAGILFGFLGDRYNGPEGNEIDRGIYYGGALITADTKSTVTTLRYLYDSGIIEHSDVLGNTPVDLETSGYLVDVSTEIDLGQVDLKFEYLYASGDDPLTADKIEGFTVPETSYRTNIAEILTRGELNDELEGDGNFAAYQHVLDFSNIFFVKGEISYQSSKRTTTTLAVIYAELPEEKTIYAPTNLRAHNVGTEVDLKVSHMIYAADEPGKGLRLDIIAAILLSGDVFSEFDIANNEINEADDIQEFGIRLVYDF
jgi:hypothetical protein